MKNARARSSEQKKNGSRESKKKADKKVKKAEKKIKKATKKRGQAGVFETAEDFQLSARCFVRLSLVFCIPVYPIR